MASSKADETWTEPEGVVCRLYNSGLVKFGVNLGWPKDMVRSTKRTLAKSAVEAVRTHKDFAFLAAYAASVASAQPMDVAQPTYAGVGQRELRGLQGAETSAPQQQQRKSVQPDQFMHSQSSVRDDYKSRNLGSRNGAVRGVSYAAATQRLEEMGLQSEMWLHELRTIVTQMDAILEDIPSEQVDAVRALQQAMLEMLVSAEGEEGGEEGGDEGEEGEPTCVPCEPTELQSAAEAYFAEVQESIAWSTEGAPPSPPLAVLQASRNGCAGGLLLTRFELLWFATGTHFSQADFRVSLREIDQVSPTLSKSPFGNRAALIILTRGQAPEHFACGSALEALELFSLELATAAAAIPGAAAAATAAPTAAAAPAAFAAPVPAAPRQTKQKLAATDMRDKLKQVVKLQRSHAAGSNQAAEKVLQDLAAADGKKAPSLNTVYKDAQRLRDVALGFGGYAISRRIIEQFIKMPVVKLCLSEPLREQIDDARDASTAKALLAEAKVFFTEIFGVGFRGGRLSDEDRNAYAVASASMLPRDLFKRRGQAAAASRLTGLGYRQLHRGVEHRRQLEDSACGWRRVKTSEHKDKVGYGPLKDAWHSDLLSTPDNQNKDMACSARACPLALTPSTLLLQPSPNPNPNPNPGRSVSSWALTQRHTSSCTTSTRGERTRALFAPQLRSFAPQNTRRRWWRRRKLPSGQRVWSSVAGSSRKLGALASRSARRRSAIASSARRSR